jgi:acyl-coenzyme A thioesterase PaaI-like protein
MELSLDDVIAKNKELLSDFFNQKFNTYLKEVKFISKDDKEASISYTAVVDKICTNPLGYVHGGATALLIESLSNSFLGFLNTERFRTLDLTINYKYPLKINEPMIITIRCQRYDRPTCFIQVGIAQEQEICVSASLIKTYLKAKF